MLGPWSVRLTRGLLAAIYLVAATTGGLLHQHAPADCAGHDHPAHCLLGHGLSAQCAGHADHDAAADDDGESVGQHGQRLADDDCVVCRFFGLSSLPVTPAALPACGELVVRANPAEPRHESRPLELTLHSRAPPVAVL